MPSRDVSSNDNSRKLVEEIGECHQFGYRCSLLWAFDDEEALAVGGYVPRVAEHVDVGTLEQDARVTTAELGLVGDIDDEPLRAPAIDQLAAVRIPAHFFATVSGNANTPFETGVAGDVDLPAVRLVGGEGQPPSVRRYCWKDFEVRRLHQELCLADRHGGSLALDPRTPQVELVSLGRE